jgi:hypothetical protein
MEVQIVTAEFEVDLDSSLDLKKNQLSFVCER